MKTKILGLSIGTNNGNLYGSKNDSILFLNYLNYLYLNNHNNSELWLKPYIFIDNNVNLNYICNFIKKIKYSYDKLLIFYSGHGYLDGILNIPWSNYKGENKKISDIEFINEISKCVCGRIDLYIILDCCFGGSFKILPNNNLKSIHLISSSHSHENASEGISSFNQLKNTFKLTKYINKLIIKEDDIILGVFTYNFLYMLIKNNIKSINDWNTLFKKNNAKVWKRIKRMSSQEPFVLW